MTKVRDSAQMSTTIIDTHQQAMTPLRNGCRNDDVITVGRTPFSVAVSVRLDQCCVCVFCTTSLAVFPTHCNQLNSNLANLEATVRVG